MTDARSDQQKLPMNSPIKQPISPAAMQLLLCILLGTVAAIGFGFVYGLAVLWMLFGHPLFWFPGLMLGAIGGALGGPLFGVLYGLLLATRRRPARRWCTAVWAAVLGLVIFAALGGGYFWWEAPRHVPQRVAIGRTIATPAGGQAVRTPQPIGKPAPSHKPAAQAAGVTGAGGLLFGLLFGATFGSGWGKDR